MASAMSRILKWSVALAALAAGAFVAMHQPLSAPLALALGIVAAAFCVWLPNGWLFLLPALLPLVDLAPWTGWITFEEFDVVILGAAAGTYGRAGWERAPARPSLSLGLMLVGGLFALSVVVALARGVADAGGFEFGWFQGYEGPMNSLRLAKPFLLALLFVPFMKPALMRPDATGAPMLAWGMAIGLGGASLAAVWERFAFPGLLNFSTDYRTTALFWEMHVGGAALDGFLALTMPFAAWLLWCRRDVATLVVGGALFGLGVYASLTTFSRGVYAAEIAGFTVLAALLLRQQAGGDSSRQVSGVAALFVGFIWMVGIVAGAFFTFRHGGYRALVAVLGVLAAFMACRPIARNPPPSQRWASALTGLVIGSLIVAVSLLVPKGVYAVYAVLVALVAGGIRLALADARWTSVSLAATYALAVAAAGVAWYWGGGDALLDVSGVLLLIVAFGTRNIAADMPLWPEDLSTQAVTLAGVAALSFAVAIFGGGRYMEGRFATSEQDFEGRLRHWQAGLALLTDPWQWAFGRGTGRFPGNFFFGAPGAEYPGTYRIGNEAGNAYLALSGAHYGAGYGEVLRMAQRVAPTPDRYRADFDLRAPKPGKLDVSLCEKHLIYAGTCAARSVPVTETADWQHVSVELDARRIDSGRWYAPRLAVFSLALDRVDTRVDIDNVRLFDSGGLDLLENGDFSGNMRRWFFTSDHHHMPWHIKSMFFHVLFEQGLLGFGAFIVLVALAFGKVAFSRASRHPVAPALAAAIAGFVVVGLFDSLLDVPRVAFLFFLLLLMAMQSSRLTR